MASAIPLELAFAFTIFFLTLGPVKTIPAFALIAADLDKPASRRLALRGFLIASLIVFATALVFQGTMVSWRVSLPAMQIAGGILLFVSASKNVSSGPGGAAGRADGAAAVKPTDAQVNARALAPLAVPSIVTPFGLVAILVFTGSAEQDQSIRLGIYGLLALMMVLNLVGMWFAKALIRTITVTPFLIIGWVFSVLQAGLAVQAVVSALRVLRVIPA